ncbi:MAG: hypothetical protein HY000_29220, partial [Planctomycetes bacterium]|nr:hypothetical protein [Planctomycetota bacterium]
TWWPDPLRGLAIFLWANLTRQKTIAIPTLFFGKTFEFSLPWYNTLAWVFLTVPPVTLLIILFGLAATMASLGRVGNREVPDAGETKDEGQKSFDSSLAWLLLLNALTLLVIRALPNAPGHDGERQMLGCFPFLACMAGIGAEAVRRQIAARVPAVIANLFTVGLVAAALVWAGAAVWHYRPAPLSYYTELVGGLRGACRLGLEPAYYWDALDDKLLDWLNSHTGRDEKVRFCAYFDSQRYLREWGKLRVKMLPHEPGVWRWYVLQNRPGPFVTRPYDRWLAEHGHAAYTKDLDGVPLIWIFPFDEYEQAIRQTKSGEDAAGP